MNYGNRILGFSFPTRRLPATDLLKTERLVAQPSFAFAEYSISAPLSGIHAHSRTCTAWDPSTRLPAISSPTDPPRRMSQSGLRAFHRDSRSSRRRIPRNPPSATGTVPENSHPLSFHSLYPNPEAIQTNDLDPVPGFQFLIAECVPKFPMHKYLDPLRQVHPRDLSKLSY